MTNLNNRASEQSDGRPIIVHIVEDFSGGVETAVGSYIYALPHIDHHLIRKQGNGNLRANTSTDKLFVSVTELPRNIYTAARVLRKQIADIQPTVIHAHSSMAGVISRVFLNSRKNRIVYTPHGFAFERQDVQHVTRFCYRLVERLLAVNTTAYAPCSKREMDLVHQIAPNASAVLVPNVSSINLNEIPVMPTTIGNDAEQKVIIAVARITAAKDPEFFTRVVSEYRKYADAKFVWVGCGDPELTRRLVDAGVEVTGWQSAEQVAGWMHAADAMVQTSRWEAMPLSLLEAETMGLPVVARKVESLAWLPSSVSGTTPSELAQRLYESLTDANLRKRILMAWKQEFSDNTVRNQRNELTKLYCINGDDFK
ncbi:glycosyltransferase [Arthrobacter sp. H35-D1]|uniref:glycosyltransferase n=1 Tax=Arthrobacter sp. H35-D1 TaxID=3046202 RepID=UPI0024B95B9F|nr:glycosyltransferase [Arthrobacter sp. H35-D1]MDJ0315359.1 glycosyltransferase [Arthrobacter sp. H35-D1]